MFQDFFIPFLTIGLAEFGDKTQLAILGLSTKTKKHLSLILGVVLAFILTDGLAVILGDAKGTTRKKECGFERVDIVV